MNALNAKMVLAISIAAFLIPLYFMVDEVLEATHGLLVYPLDDTYIHLAVAKNLALNNTWGISPHEFASASSSILYPLLLTAIFKITGVQMLVPFIVNLVTAIIFIYVVQQWLVRQSVAPSGQLIVLLLTIFLTPLPCIVFVSMEHTLHLLFFFLFLTSFTAAVETMVAFPAKKPILNWRVYLYGILMMTARFESMALLVMACLILIYYRRWLLALQLGFICFLPVLIFGLYSLSKGSFFLPNSVMIKPALPPLRLSGLLDYIETRYLPRFFTADESYNTLGVQRLLLILPLTYLIFLRATREKMAYRYMLIMLIVCTVFHMATMSYSFFARYEAYIVGTSVIVCATLFVKYGHTKLEEKGAIPEYVAYFFGLILLAPLATRSWTVFNDVPHGAISTYGQQYQMGRFVHEFYNQQPVAINDIGAVAWQSEGKNLDLWGLGDNDIARHRRNRTDSAGYLDSMSRKKDVQIAIIYENRFQPLVQRWQKIASWDIPYKEQEIYDSVSFYAVNPSEAPRLLNNLKIFQSSLPHGVIVRYY